MNAENVGVLSEQPDIDGGLIGGASKKWDTAAPIYRTFAQKQASSSPVANTRGQGSGDRGQEENFVKGGIDLNSALLDLQITRDGNGVPLPLPMQPIENMHIEGFLPVIINVTPVTNLPLLLGIADDQLPADSADSGAPSMPMELSLAVKDL